MINRSHVQGTWIDYPWSERPTGEVHYLPRWDESVSFFSLQWPREHDGTYRNGGRFNTCRQFIRSRLSQPIRNTAFGQPTYVGSFRADAPALIPFPSHFTSNGWVNRGPELYARGKPAKPEFQIGNALYELRELPSLLKQRFEFNELRDIGSFHLALQFGWLSLLRDVRSFYQTSIHMDKSIKQLIRDNGKPIRRMVESHKDAIDTSTAISSGLGFRSMIGPRQVEQAYGHGQPDPWQLLEKKKQRIWMVAKYRYYLPEKGMLSDLQYSQVLRRRLQGATVSPKNIYDAMPWTWLVDYFGNIGDNISNLDAGVADNLINDFAYIMRHVEESHELSGSCHMQTGYPTRAARAQTEISCATERGYVAKDRYRASPFGFDVDMSNLTDHQAGILAALGLSRRR